MKNTCFQNKMCPEATIGEFAISLVLVISCEPVKVESESRKFSEEQHVYVACLQMAIKTITGIPCSNILAKVCIYRDITVFIDG